MLKNKFCDFIRYYASRLAMSCFLGKAREEWEKNYKKTIEQSKYYENNLNKQNEKEEYYQELESENKILIQTIIRIDKFARNDNLDAIKEELRVLKGKENGL